MVHFKLNERGGGAAGCHCELFISGGSRGYVCQATQLHVMAAFHFVFSMSKTSQGEWGTSFVAEIIFHFQMSFALMHRFWRGRDRVGEEEERKSIFQTCHLKRSLTLQSAFFTSAPPPPSFSVLSLSLYIYLISPTKPITAMFLQPLQSHSASYWPFTRLPYNTHNHWISNPLLELE